jgi:hypothetical protein
MGGSFSYEQKTATCCEQCIKNNKKPNRIEKIDSISYYESKHKVKDGVKHLYRCSKHHTFYIHEGYENYNKQILEQRETIKVLTTQIEKLNETVSNLTNDAKISENLNKLNNTNNTNNLNYLKYLNLLPIALECIIKTENLLDGINDENM